MTKVFDPSGKPTPAPTEAVFNDLTQAPTFDALPNGTVQIPVVIPAENGLKRIGLMSPSAIVTAGQLDSVQSTVSTLAADVSAIKPKADAVPTTQQAIQSLQSAVASIPAAATTMPPAVTVDGSTGSGGAFARSDHTHAARVQRKIVTLAANGTASWTFTKPFTAEPSLQYMVFQASGEPVVVEANSWIMDGSNRYAGVNVSARRSRPLPTLTALSGALTLLSGVISGVNTLVTALTGFNVFGTSALEGVKVHLSVGEQM